VKTESRASHLARGKGLLFRRKEAKDFYVRVPRKHAGHGRERGSGAEIKVFCFFSSEKKAFVLTFARAYWATRNHL
jgi:hypothetical protein